MIFLMSIFFHEFIAKKAIAFAIVSRLSVVENIIDNLCDFFLILFQVNKNNLQL